MITLGSELDRLTFPGLLRLRARTHAGRAFIRDEERSLTYAQVDERTTELARGLVAAGLRSGEAVALLLDNCLEFVVAWFAVLKAGAVVAPISTQLIGEGLAYNVRACQPAVVIGHAPLLARVEAFPDGVRAVYVVGHGVAHATDPRVRPLPTAGSPDGAAAGSAVELPEIGPAAPCQVMFTSGTTGHPKGVLRFTDIELRKAALAEPSGLTDRDILYCPVPLHHGLGLNWVQMALWAGASVAIVDRFTVRGFRDDIDRYAATAMPHVGTMVSALMSSPARADDAASTLRVSFGVGVPAHLWVPFEQRFGLSVVEFYGSTETGLIMFNPPGGVPGSVGRVVPGVEIRLVDAAGRRVPAGTPAELHVRRSGQRGMPAYLGHGPAPAEASNPDGWFRTGDLLRRGDDGYYFYVGRSKATIRRRGENIIPEDIERVVDQHPGVAESAAVAAPSELGEDDVRLFVVARQQSALLAGDLQSWLRDRLPRFMQPRYIEFIDQMPRTATHKLQRDLLRGRPLP